jgi:ribosomal protein S18 acetylase RimI-like enzyme
VVETPAITGELYLAEIHVHPERRGRGVGGRLLSWAEERGSELGFTRIWLTTGSGNPSRHLYERHGFQATASTRSRLYRRFTGNDGRVRMEKSLGVAGVDSEPEPPRSS